MVEMSPQNFVELVGFSKAKKSLKAPYHTTHIRSDFEYFSNRIPSAKGWFKFDDVSDCWVEENPYLKEIVKLSDLKDFIMLAEVS